MGKDLFDFDSSLDFEQEKPKPKKKGFEEELHRAEVLCIRGQYDKSLKIYEAILDEDIDNQDAYLGLLRVHSEDFTLFEGKDIENDIKVIEKLFEDIDTPEYLSYMKKRNAFLKEKSTKQATPQPAPKVAPAPTPTVAPTPVSKPAPAPAPKPVAPSYSLPIRINKTEHGIFNIFSQDALDKAVIESYNETKSMVKADAFNRAIDALNALKLRKPVYEQDVNQVFNIFWDGILKGYAPFVILNSGIGAVKHYQRARGYYEFAYDMTDEQFGGLYNFFTKNGVSPSQIRTLAKQFLKLCNNCISLSRSAGENDGGVLLLTEDMCQKLLARL